MNDRQQSVPFAGVAGYGLLFVVAYAIFFVWEMPEPDSALPSRTALTGSDAAYVDERIPDDNGRAGSSESPEASPRPALRNAGSPAAAREEEGSPAVAEVAVIQETGPDESVLALISETVSEADPAVRARAIGRLRNSPVSADSIQALASAASRDIEARNRILAISALQNLALRGEHQEVIRSALEQATFDPEPRVARVARNAYQGLFGE